MTVLLKETITEKDGAIGGSIHHADNWQAVSSIAGEWDRLVQSSPTDSIFLRWAWIQAWHDAGGHRVRPAVTYIRDRQGRLVGLAPFYLDRCRFCRLVPYRILRVLGDYGSGAEETDLVVHRDGELNHIEWLFEAVCRMTTPWDGIWLPYLPVWRARHDRIKKICKKLNLRAHCRPQPFCAVSFPDDFDDYLMQLGPNTRSQLRRQQKAVFSRPDVRVTECEAPEQVPEFLAALFDLHAQRWQLKGEAGSFVRKPMLRRFYERFKPLMARRGWLRIYALKEGRHFRAVQIGYLYNGVFMQIQEGFDPTFVPGSGNVLRLEVIRRLIGEGVRRYDFLAGVDPHKLRWGAQVSNGASLFLVRRSMKTAPLFALGPVWPTGRYLRPAHGSLAD